MDAFMERGMLTASRELHTVTFCAVYWQLRFYSPWIFWVEECSCPCILPTPVHQAVGHFFLAVVRTEGGHHPSLNGSAFCHVFLPLVPSRYSSFSSIWTSKMTHEGHIWDILSSPICHLLSMNVSWNYSPKHEIMAFSHFLKFLKYRDLSNLYIQNGVPSHDP